MASAVCAFCGTILSQAIPTLTRRLCSDCQEQAEGVFPSTERIVLRDVRQQ
jgi:hypothetical protein